MKNRIYLLFAFLAILWSCNDESLDVKTSNIDTETSIDKTVLDDEGRVCATDESVAIDSINGRVSHKYLYWDNGQTIRIKFLNGNSSQQYRVRYYASEWTRYANLKFQWVASYQDADIKIQFGSSTQVAGWSYVGKTARSIAQNKPSMFFATTDKGTVLHEFGHALNLLHEHQNPTGGIAWNKPVVYNYFAKIGWTRDMVDSQIFNKSSRSITDYSYTDDASIMIYWIPRTWTTNGFYSKNNGSLSNVDKAQIGLMYPYNKPGLRTHALYRYWSVSQTDHFYTSNWNELRGGRYSYVYEGVMGYMSPTQVAGTVPLHRYWNAGAGDHFYTTNYRELGDKRYGWVYEGVIGYVYTSKASNRKPLYRYWNGRAADHFYTTNWNELKGGNSYWKYEGVVGYLMN